MSSNARAATPYTFKCRVCGKDVDLTALNLSTNFFSSILKTCRDERICLDCVLCLNTMGSYTPNRYVIGGVCYDFIPINVPKGVSGKRYILTDKGEAMCVLVSCIVGTVPQHLRRLIPDTARFISKKAHTFIKKRSWFHCRKKGCYDRYHCIWYNQSEMEPNGSWNKIPDWHQPGWEECPLFINKIIK